MPTAKPELNQYQGKRVLIQMDGGRSVQGIVRGFDVFLNLVLSEAVEVMPGNKIVQLGLTVVRGSSVVMVEALERIEDIIRKEEKSGRR